MQNERNVTIAVEKTPAFTETWYEGFVKLDGEKHQFWLIHPNGVDPNGNEYEIDVRWFFARVPREVRALIPQIIDEFKSKAQDENHNPR